MPIAASHMFSLKGFLDILYTFLVHTYIYIYIEYSQIPLDMYEDRLDPMISIILFLSL